MKLVALFVLLATASAQDCGHKVDQPPWWPTQYITYGRDSFPGAWPWQLSLQYINPSGGYSHTCGASLYQKGWVITAAHCVDGKIASDPGREDPSNFRLLAGAYNLSSLDSGVQILKIKTIHKHADFDGDPITGPINGFPYDIALLELAQPAELTDRVGLVCLPPADEDFAHNDNCWITGWGKTFFIGGIPEILQEGATSPLSVAECQADHVGTILDSHLCTGGGRPGACSGDSGGPYSCEVDGKWYVAGLASWTNIFCDGLPAVYTRITSYLDWMESTMASA